MATSAAGLVNFSKVTHTTGDRSVVEREQVEFDSFVLPTSSANGVFVDKSKFSAMAIHVDGAGGGTITFWGCTKTARDAANGAPTLVQLYDKTGAAITLTVGGAGIYNVNPEIFGVPCVAPVINSGTVNAVIVLTK